MSKHVFFSFPGDWKCNSGQGQSGKSIHGRQSNNLDECKLSCLEFEGCIGIDYTKTGLSCRMFSHNTPREDPGRDLRTYCTRQKEGKKMFD